MTERLMDSPPGPFAGGLFRRKEAPVGAYDEGFFRRRTIALALAAFAFLALGALSGTYVGFDFAGALVDIPGGFA